MSMETIIIITLCLFIFIIIYKLNNVKPKRKVTSSIPLRKSFPKFQAKPASSTETINNINTTTEPTSTFEVPENFLTFKLIGSNSGDAEQKNLITDISQSFNKPHPLILPLIKGVFEPNELFDLIKTDVEMTAKILNVVNSPLFALRRPITNINHAVIFLGIVEVKNIALSIALKNDIKVEGKLQNEAYKKLWLASSLASSLCLLFTKELGEENSAELSTHCLLSYLGDLATLSYQPSTAEYYSNEYNIFNRTNDFQNALGTNVAIIGCALAAKWQLPDSIQLGIQQSLLPLSKCFIKKLISPKEMQQIIIAYICCRIGDLVAFNGMTDLSEIENLSFESTGKIEFYYIQQGIDISGFNNINTVFENTVFRNKANTLIQQSINVKAE